jgi:nitrate/nitrite-specific signal transduction histidine kinase
MNEQTEGLSELEPEISEREKAEEALQKAHDELEQRVKERTHDLGERIKELNCLYGISKLIEKSGICLEEIIKGVVDIIPPSWQYPEVTCSRILLKDEAYKTENFQSTNWKQSSGIFVHGKQVGTLVMALLPVQPAQNKKPAFDWRRYGR